MLLFSPRLTSFVNTLITNISRNILSCLQSNSELKSMAVDEDRALWEKNLRFSTQRVDGEDGHRHDFTIMCNGKRFVVTVCPTPHPEDPITPLLSQYNKAFLEDDDDENLQKAQDEIEDIIYEAGWRKFAPLAPGMERGPLNPPISLHFAINPETFYFHLVMDGGNADVIQEHPSRSKYVPSYLAINVTSNLPRYSAREILFTKKLMGTGYIAKVSVNRQDMCCKMLVPTDGKAVQREYECLKKIADSKHASSIKAPRLIGFVVNGGDDEGVIGILEEYIPHTMNLGGSQSDIKAAASERRRKWAEQVRRNIELLHEIGVVWGDGKPENVLINSETDDCCLVDFGGSWTDGWVDAKLMETKVGDEQALTRIFDFLGV
ncbi:hypothetical protein G7Y89_g4721 [Cudoniella acicularis]|uniref:Protein kinase domain-containing protein n=1 Tax=Cudoniella acicularis TaxID=354080 RepID=A0A8H4W761_9HELO|nr:hypothetical protein G7Y89_g4721 [Cudoniella acicularis]